MIDLLTSAVNNESNKEYTFSLNGDLCQMSAQRTFLNNRGIVTKQNNVYPCVRECDIKQALELIWKFKVEGWWHYEEKYIEFGICSKDEFRNRLKNA